MTLTENGTAALQQLIGRLQRAKLDWDAENIADWLWLARYMDGEISQSTEDTQNGTVPSGSMPRTPTVAGEATPPPPPTLDLTLPPPARRGQQTEQPAAGGIPFKVPTAPALRRTLNLGRALRPLMRKVDSYTETVLDEVATAEQTAEQRFCLTVTQPAQERWLEVALVVEATASSFLWQETIRDFKLVLERQGAFRTLSVWYLCASHSGSLQLLAHSPDTVENQQARSVKELFDAAGRRLILLASDCISPAWQSGAIQHCLEQWANRGPVAILQLLPSRLWERSVLSAGLSVQFGALMPGVSNPQLRLQDLPAWAEESTEGGLKLPVVTLEPTSLHRWARMLAGYGESWATGILFDEGWQHWQQENQTTVELLPEQLVQRFSNTASLLARRLAGLMAMVPVSLPIIYLIQETLLPDSTQLQVAEVFMSGLIRRVDKSAESDTTSKEYDFVSGVREQLIDAVSLPDAEAVLDRVSQYIGDKVGRSIYSFTALLMLERELSGTAGTELLKFASLTKQVLRRLGGEYAQLVESVEAGNLVGIASHESNVPNFPDLQPFEFIEAELVDDDDPGSFPPLLQPNDFTIVTFEFDPETASNQKLDPFEIVVAELTRHQGKWQIERQKERAYRLIEALPDNAGLSFFSGLVKRLGFQRDRAVFGLEIVAIPGGSFIMGSPQDEPERYDYESPQHEVTVEPFFMGRYPVTQAQWAAVASLPKVERDLNPDPSHFKGANRPVESVSWYSAIEFCQRLSQHSGRPYRLPSEAEWEYACRANTTTPFHVGNTLTTEVANYDGRATYGDGLEGEYRHQTTEVEHFGLANGFGLSDMHGNVWEWCQDDWHESYEGAPSDGSAWVEGGSEESKIIRGGSWYYHPRGCRSAHRDWDPPGCEGIDLGFRVCCSSPRT